MRTNVAATIPMERTHEGGAAERSVPSRELERTVLSCMLWEDTFYESGSEVGGRIAGLCAKVPNDLIFELAHRARNQMGLRHVPLWLLVQVARKGPKQMGLAGAIANTIRRPDEMAELLALYWKDGRVPISAQIKKGLARAFGRFSSYQLSKWDRDGRIKLRDVMFLSHPKPKDTEQAALWKQVAARTLDSPDTWEVALSTGKNKRESWERLLSEKKLGIMALLKNLRNMHDAGVPTTLVADALRETEKGFAFPYRFLTAARYAPWLASELSDAMLERIREMPKLRGETHVIVDVSGSMDERLSGRGEAVRLDAASSIAICARELCDSARIFTFSQQVAEVGNVRGLPLAAAISQSQPHGGTYLSQALGIIRTKGWVPDRIIVITDEQTHDGNAPCHARRSGYIVNVAPYKNGLESKQKGWSRVNGWSDRLLEWIAVAENEAA